MAQNKNSPTEQVRVYHDSAEQLRRMISGKENLWTIGDVVKLLLHEHFSKTKKK